MRDSLNYTMLPPAVQDNCLTYSRNGTITTLPSNGYYGYQPPINSDNDNRFDNKRTNEGQQQQMDVVMQFEEYDNRRRFETVNNRKRCWEISGDVRQFKKRRQNCDVYNYENVDDNAKKKLNKDDDLFEELLNETHGCSIYHWIATNS